MFQFVGSRQKIMIIKLYKSKIAEQPNLKIKEVSKMISLETGVGKNTVQSTISDYKNSGVVKAPNRKKARPTIVDKTDDAEKEAIRRHVHNIWFRREVPRIDKILSAVNDDPDVDNYSRSTLHRFLKQLNFVNAKRGRNSALIERDDIVVWRNRYLEQIRKFREEGRSVYYLGETCIDAGECSDQTMSDGNVKSRRGAVLPGVSNPRGKRLIVVHVGSEEGFVPGGLLAFCSKKNTLDFRDEIDGDIFFDWMKTVVPLMKEKSVLVMDNASYHSVETEPCPNMSWKKEDMENWLEDKGETLDKPIIKVRLMEMVRRGKPVYVKTVIDEYVKSKDMVVLRLPPYHCELNAIELAWSSIKNHVKMNNTTFKIEDVEKLLREGVERCTPEMWSDFVKTTEKVEERLWDIDFIVEDVMENIDSTTMTMSVDTTSESDSEPAEAYVDVILGGDV